MFQHAIKTGIPIIAVTCDDPVNLAATLRHWSGKFPAAWPNSKQVVLKPDYLYYTSDMEQLTVENYMRCHQAEVQLVIVNPEKKSNLVFEAGELPTPEKFIRDYLHDLVAPDRIEPLVQSLRGCSLKSASEVSQLSFSLYQELSPKSVASLRMRLNGATPGLFPMMSEIGYWQPHPEISDWIALSAPYMKLETPPSLQPKGLMLHGQPGTGKSMAAEVVAKAFSVPAFRLDIPTTLNRFIGESEARVARNLDLLLQYSPCVVLLDEVEKVFGEGQDQGTTTRLLSQLLWWLQSRPKPCPVIMTTNKLSAIPPELYRLGRLDKLIEVSALGMDAARHLAAKVFKQLVPNSTKHQGVLLRQLFGDPLGRYVPSQVVARVVELVKEHKWA